MKIKEKRKIERGKLRNIIHTRNSDKEKFRSNSNAGQKTSLWLVFVQVGL